MIEPKEFYNMPRNAQNKIAEDLNKKYANTDLSQRPEWASDIMRYAYLREEFETYGEC